MLSSLIGNSKSRIKNNKLLDFVIAMSYLIRSLNDKARFEFVDQNFLCNEIKRFWAGQPNRTRLDLKMHTQ